MFPSLRRREWKGVQDQPQRKLPKVDADNPEDGGSRKEDFRKKNKPSNIDIMCLKHTHTHAYTHVKIIRKE